MKKYTLAAVVFTLSLVCARPVSADWLIDRSGTLVQIDGRILGDEDIAEGLAADPKRATPPGELEKSRQLLKRQTEARLKEQAKAQRKSNVEIRRDDGKYTLKQEVKDARGRLVQQQEVEVKEGESVHVEQEDGEMVRIDERRDGRLEIVKNKVKTASDLDLQVGDKNEISVTLPNGKVREVALPDKALERLIANGVIANTEGGEESQYELIAGKNGDPVYEVEGTVEKKLFGLFKLKFAQKMEVAASASDDGSVVTGDIVETESHETGWKRFFERFSL